MLSKTSSRTIEKPSSTNLANSLTGTFSENELKGFLGRNVLLLNSISLDAPLVAVIWLKCFSSIYSISVEVHHYLILFSVTWLAYSGDRLLDSIRFPAVDCKSPRHQFATDHFKTLISIWITVAVISSLYLFIILNISEIVWGLFFLGLLLVYFLGCYLFPDLLRGAVPRELVVGLFFSLAVHFFILFQLGHWGLYSFWTFLCFLSLCSLNCLSISYCEYSSDVQAGETSFFTRNPKRLHRFRYALTWFLCLQLVVCVFSIVTNYVSVFEISVLLSTILLLILDRSLVNPRLKPVLADFTLFTPCLFWGVT